MAQTSTLQRFWSLGRLVLGLALAAPLPAQGDCVPHVPRSYAVGSRAYDFALLDLELDADLDAVVGTTVNGTRALIVLANNGLGVFSPLTTLPIPSLSTIAGVVAGDIDGDLDRDVVVSGGMTSILVYRNNAGTLALAATLVSSSTSTKALLADLDGDADLDLVNGLTIWSNDGAGVFTPAGSLPQTAPIQFLSLGDYDGDGDIDVSGIEPVVGAPLLRTWHNAGALVFTPQPPIGLGSAAIRLLESGDVDGDGQTDRVYALSGALGLRVLRATGTDSYPVAPGTASGVALGDLDTDGDLDLAYSDNYVRLLVNQGGTFTPGGAVSAGHTFGGIPKIADVDGDGTSDVVCVEPLIGTFSPRLSRLGLQPPDKFGAPLLTDLQLVDLDADGHKDALGRAFPPGSSLWRNTGAGSFVATAFPALSSAGPMRVIDMNGDGRPEIVRADRFAPSVEIYFNAGGMSFSPAFGQNSGAGAGDLASGDIDRDGDIDLVIGSLNDTLIHLLRNDGSGVLSYSSITIFPFASKVVEVADVTGDTWPDIVVAMRSSDGLLVLPNDGSGGFLAPQTIPSFSEPVVLTTGDLDRDGDIDLVVSTRFGNQVSVLKNQGTGTFVLAQQLPTDFDVLDIVLGALDGGGSPDLCVLDGSAIGPSSPGRISVWSNHGDGTFEYRSTHYAGQGATSCAVADLDFNGRNEIYATTGVERPFWRFENTGGCVTGTPVCLGDGSQVPCPCANNGASGHGCANSLFPGGARLAGSGVASVAHDTLLLECTDMTGGVCIFVQGSQLTAPVLLDDGLTCVGSILRLGNAPTVGAGAVFPQLGNLPVSVRGQVPAGGGTFHYQSYYRNAAATFCPPATSNRTNGLTIVWAP